MDAASLQASGLWLMFALGLRHGLDPDHIAMIDSVAYRNVARHARLAPWSGTLFALGHGLAVTAIAFALGAFAGGIALPAPVRMVLDWMPTVLLLAVGTLNLLDLAGQNEYRPRGWKLRFVPARLRDSSHPASIFLVGVLFALVFDTATQAAAWGYAASSGSGLHMALFAGLAFTAGMVITDTVDSRLMATLLRRAPERNGALAYRRRIGWLVVLMSYGMAAYAIFAHVRSDVEVGDFVMTALGCALFLSVLLAGGIARKPRTTSWKLDSKKP